MIKSENAERQAILAAAKLMLISARIAPKSAGIDDVLAIIVHGEEKDAITSKMEEMAEERKIEDFRRDAKNVRDAEAAILIGVRGNKSFGLNCGACSYKNYKEFDDAQKFW